MVYFELQQTANQEFTTEINGNAVLIRLNTFRDMTYASITINEVNKANSVRCVPNRSIFEYEVNSILGGELMFKCSTDDYPYYENFNNVDVMLVFVPNEEL